MAIYASFEVLGFLHAQDYFLCHHTSSSGGLFGFTSTKYFIPLVNIGTGLVPPYSTMRLGGFDMLVRGALEKL